MRFVRRGCWCLPDLSKRRLAHRPEMWMAIPFQSSPIPRSVFQPLVSLPATRPTAARHQRDQRAMVPLELVTRRDRARGRARSSSGPSLAPENTSEGTGDLSDACLHGADRAGSSVPPLPAPLAVRYRTASTNAVNQSPRRSESLPSPRAPSEFHQLRSRYSTPLANSCPVSPLTITRVACAPVMILRLGRRSGSPSRKA